jgi:two-component system response regulator QseB
LLARIRALLRRHLDHAGHLAVPGGSLDIAGRTVRRTGGAAVALSEREASLLALLAARPTIVLSRSELLESVFDDAESETVVDTYVHYLRRKLGRGVISTVRGLGYRLGSS